LALIDRNIVLPPPARIPLQKNRLIALFTDVPSLPMPEVGPTLVPLFADAGQPPMLYFPYQPSDAIWRPVSLGEPVAFTQLALVRPLYIAAEKRASTEAEIDRFLDLVSKVSEALTNFVAPKGWLAKRRASSSGFAFKPIMAKLEMSREQAIATARAYEAFLNNLPGYQRTVRIVATGCEVGEDELADFAEFVGLRPIRDGELWGVPELGAFLLRGQRDVVLSMPSVPATPQPEAVYENLLEIAQRLTKEFGGRVMVDDKLARQILVGWQNLLARIHLRPGEEVAKEFFPPGK